MVFRQTYTPEFHQVDMMGVVHNLVYLHWFESCRNKMLFSVIPPEDALSFGIALPVTKNVCNHSGFTRLGDTVVVTTRHRVFTTYQGSFVFHHSIVNKRDKKEVASGETVLTTVQWPSGKLLREFPEDLYKRYLDFALSDKVDYEQA
ncbi:MAG TPA: thioesterase family protein [Chitinispirillaceae bacterium]|nr:thioesterase family protein [Chitinispirillaceae bacterium]